MSDISTLRRDIRRLRPSIWRDHKFLEKLFGEHGSLLTEAEVIEKRKREVRLRRNEGLQRALYEELNGLCRTQGKIV